MNGFSRLLSGNGLFTKKKSKSDSSWLRLPRHTTGPLGKRGLRLEALEERRLLAVLAVAINATTISEAGTDPVPTCTITLDAPAASALLINLTAVSDPSDATADVNIPPSVTINSGESTTSFPINVLNNSLVDGTRTVTITADATGYDSDSAAIAVTDNDANLTVAITPATFAENVGSVAAIGTVTRNGPTTSALLVSLTSSDTTESTVPSTVTIPIGEASVTFNVAAQDDSVYDDDQVVSITATATGFNSGSASVTVQDNELPGLTLSISPSTIWENTGAGVVAATGRVSRDDHAPNAAPLVVQLFSNDTTEATVPASVVIPAGALSVNFSVYAVDDALVDGTKSVTITAIANDPASPHTQATTTISVLDDDVAKTLTVEISPRSIAEDQGLNAATGTVTVSVAPTANLLVTLSNDDAGEATLSANTVTILAGQTSAGFLINAVDDTIEDGAQTVTVTATANGYAQGSTTLSVTDNEEVLSLTVDINVFLETAGPAASTATLTRTGSTNTALTVSLNNSDVSEISIPTTVTIPAGQISTTFAIGAVNDYIVDGTQNISIAAFATGYGTGTVNLSVLDAQATPTLSVGNVALPEDSTSQPFVFTITLSATSTSVVTVQYATSDGTATAESDYKTKGGSVTILPGKTTVEVTIPVYGDYLTEADETFFFTLSNALGANIAVPQAVGTILNDDGVTPSGVNPGADTIGLFNPAASTFYLKNSNSAGFADNTFNYGPAGANWQTIAGDWNGDGVTTIGLYNPTASVFYLKDSNSAGFANLSFNYGPAGAGWTPIAGDWDGDGITTVGLYNAATSTFYLRNANASGVADLSFVFGTPAVGLRPVVGDWNGDQTDTIGVYNPSDSVFSLRNLNSAGAANVQFTYGPAGAAWAPFAGDWDGNGTTTVGLYDRAAANFYLRNANSSGFADNVFAYGQAGGNWTPIAGDWNGSPSALHVAGGEAAARSSATSLTEAALQPLVQEAIARWAATGISSQSLVSLSRVNFVIADLSGSHLGLADGNTIYVDRDAAGYGWFLDATPGQDEEFSAGVAINPRAVDSVDLLTVVEHELGHILGHADLEATLDSLMSGVLSPGVRRGPAA